jgi:hypothetical protein
MLKAKKMGSGVKEVAMEKVTIEFEIAQAQEVASTIRTTVKKIDFVLDNPPPKMKPGQLSDLDVRAKILTVAAQTIEDKLHARALANVVKIADKK